MSAIRDGIMKLSKALPLTATHLLLWFSLSLLSWQASAEWNSL